MFVRNVLFLSNKKKREPFPGVGEVLADFLIERRRDDLLEDSVSSALSKGHLKGPLFP